MFIGVCSLITFVECVWVNADQGRSELPTIAAYLLWPISPDVSGELPTRQGRRGLPCRPSRSRGTDRLRVYFGIFDRIFQKKSSTPSSSSIFSLCPLCSLVARSKTGGEYNWWRMNGRAATHPYHRGLPIPLIQRERLFFS